MKTYRAAVIGCGRMGGFIDNEVVGEPKHEPPYAHGGGFYACDRTDLVACSDFREDLMALFGEQYAVPKSGQYTDYQEMIAKENLDIVSVATHVEHHADIVIHAAEQGVKAIFCEKGMAPSLATANAMAAACERHGTVFNMGTQRRYHPGFWQMREIIAQGELGALQSLVMTYGGGLFDHGCHTMDLAQYLNGDIPAVWVQGHAPSIGAAPRRPRLPRRPRRRRRDPLRERRHPVPALHQPLRVPGQLRAWHGRHLQRFPRLGPAEGRRPQPPAGGIPRLPRQSPTVNAIMDLVRALDTGDPPRGGVESARHGVEIMVAILESHLQGGKRITLPLRESNLRMHRTDRDAWQKGLRWREPKLTV